jgi:hypothetical protein
VVLAVAALYLLYIGSLVVITYASEEPPLVWVPVSIIYALSVTAVPLLLAVRLKTGGRDHRLRQVRRGLTSSVAIQLAWSPLLLILTLSPF